MAKEKKLTPRQWELFRLFKQAKRLLHNKEIQQLMPEAYPYDPAKSSNWNYSKARRNITEDTKALAASTQIDDVVIADINLGSGIPTAEEYHKWAMRERAYLSEREKKKRIIEYKASLHGQYNLVFGREKPIREAYAEVRQ